MKKAQSNNLFRRLFTKKVTYILCLIVIIMGLLFMISGTSYSFLIGSTISDSEQIIKAGDVELELTENYENLNNIISVLSDTDGLLQEKVYNFNIKNIGDVSAKYDVKLINEVPSNYDGPVLDDKYVKVGLEINGEEHGPFSLEEAENILDSGVIYRNEIINYTLKIWLSEEYKEEILDLDGAKSFYKINEEAEQRINTTTIFSYTGDMQKYEVPVDGYYYIELAGASGNNEYNDYVKNYSTYGAKTSGYVYLKKDETLYFYVGGMGKTFNCCSKQGEDSGSGGATDVRIYKNKEPEDRKYRYVRNYINGSSANEGNHWVELKVYDESGNLISDGKKVNYNGNPASAHADPSVVTDGNTDTTTYFELVSNNSGNPYVEIDLGSEYIISKVEVWHYYGGTSRKYYNNKTELISSDKTIYKTIYDSDTDGTYAETSSGKTILNKYLYSDLASRIMVAAGAGGTYYDSSFQYGTNGGTLYSGSVNNHSNYSATQIFGGEKGTGGTDGSFGYGGTSSNKKYNSGGGGYYGGGAGPSGVGGSSYISGYAGVNSVDENIPLQHTNQTLHYSGKYFIGGKMIEGQNDGNGYAKITYMDKEPKKKTDKLNNVRYIKNCISYNTVNDYNHWTEIQAIKDGVNVAKDKVVSGTVTAKDNKPYTLVTDGDISNIGNYAEGLSNTTNQCVTVDLGDEYNLDEVAVWNYIGNQRVYYDGVTSVSSDNNHYTEIISDTGTEISNGHRINAYIDNYNGYISDGLTLWYDGYSNTGSNRNQTTTTWKDLSGNDNDGILNGGTWYSNYLSFDGIDDFVETSNVVNYNNSKAFTLQFVGTVKEKDTGIIFESSNNANNNDGSYYVVTNNWYGNNDLSLLMSYPSYSLLNLKMANNILSQRRTLYTVIFDSTREHNSYIIIYKNKDLVDIESVALSSADSDGNLSNKTINDYIFYIASRAGNKLFSEMDLNSLRIYKKALTYDEIVQNYNYDRKKFKLE